MKRRPYIGPSDSQVNADAIARRGAPYSAASDASFRVAWDWHRREPADLREAVRMVRAAYSDEVPTRLHEHAIGDDGTPRMTPAAEGYIFGSAASGDGRTNPETGERDLVEWYRTPFRAHLANLERGDEGSRKRAAIVGHVTTGDGPREAAIAEGVPSWCARLVAEDALRSFLRGLSDLKVNARRHEEALQEGITAA